MGVLSLRWYLLAGDLSIEEALVDAGAVLLSAGEVEVLHGKGVLSTDRLRPVTPHPPHAPVKRFDIIRQASTEVCEPSVINGKKEFYLKASRPLANRGMG